MKGLFFVVAIIGAFYFLFRYMRQREIDAFLDADMVDFQTFKVAQKQSEEPDPLMARAEAFAALNPSVVSLKPQSDGDDESAEPSFVPDPTLYHLKEWAYDEVTRNVLVQLSKIVPGDVTVLANVPLAEFVRAENAQDAEYKLANTRIAFLICEASTLTVVCGLQLRDFGVQNTGLSGSTAQGPEFIKGVFGDIGRPLLEFPLSHDISDYEIRDKLEPILAGRGSQECPKCGESMKIRKAVKGSNAGNVFWVCSRFPGCRGVIRV